jgi:hypothetical protein
VAELKDEALRAVVLGALRDLIDGEYGNARGVVLPELVTAWDALGVKSLDVRLPGGETVATITLIEPSDEVVVTNRSAFTTWVQKRAPEMVTEYESPIDRVAQLIRIHGPEVGGQTGAAEAEKWTRSAALAVLAELGVDPETPEPRVSRSYEAALLAELKPVEPYDPTLPTGPDIKHDYSAVLPETGEVVPGVEYRPAPKPKSFQLRYKPGGREAIAQAWRQRRLPTIEGLPEVEA